MDHETAHIEAAKVYAELLAYNDPTTIRMALRKADHEGWMRAWALRGEMAEEFYKHMWPMILSLGVALGATVMALLHHVLK